jgi:hypothetical protein
MQRELAEILGAPMFETPGDHGAVIEKREEFERALLAALTEVQRRSA